MKTFSLFLLVTILLVSLLVPFANSTQPPVVTDTLYVGTIGWGPARADPARAYDTGSGELIFNVYDTLIAMNGEVHWGFTPLLAANVPTREEITESITSAEVNLTSPTGSNWSDGSLCVGWVDSNFTGTLDVADTIYLMDASGNYRTWLVQALDAGPPAAVTLWRGRYVFQMRTGTVIDFVDETGQVVDTLDVSDVEYSFKRGLVQDQTSGPQWMFYKPFFDQMNSDPFSSNATEPTATTLAHLIDNTIEANVTTNTITINVGFPFPDIAFKQILSQTWASIVSREFSLSIGCWNGDLFTVNATTGYPLWWQDYRRASKSPYDKTHRYVGTGPYHVSLFDPINSVVRLTANPFYWRGWPALGAKNNLTTIEIQYISDSNSRINSFITGDLDVCAVPRSMMGSLLDASGEPKYPDIKTIKNLTPSLQMAAVHFTFTINAESPYIGNGQFPNGIPTDFFNNTHARRAFAYAFNRTRYVGDVYGGEALWPQTPLIEGLSPDYRTGVTGYDADFASAEAELKQALFNGTSVWETGFSLAWLSTTLSGPDYVYQNLHDFFSALSTYDGRPPEWPDFVINIVYIIWSDYLARLDNFELPMWTMGWISDFSDADNFMRPYVYSKGDFPKLQNYTAANGWGPRKDELVDVAVRTYDGPNRAAMYGELEQTYINDCPSFPIAQPLGRRWSKYWVRGWYYNVLCQSQDYYRMWKEDTCWYDIAGAEAAGQPGVSDGICNTRDITYLILRFEARPPSPVAGSDPKWVGTYGCGGVDPSGDRICNTRDITFAILHFNHKNQP